MIYTPWWILALLVQLTLIGLFAAWFFYLRTSKANAAHAELQKRLQQQLVRATDQKLKIAEMELQLESLQAFEEMYFELQEQHDKLQALQDEFAHKANALLSDEDQAKLQGTLHQLQAEKDKLEQKLKAVDSALHQILVKQHFPPEQLESAGRAALAAADLVEVEVKAIGDVIEQQQRLITELNTRVNSLQLEVDAKQQLESAIDQLRQQNMAMSDVLNNLKQQNQDLREQIMAMEVRERAAGNHLEDEVKRLQQTLAEKDNAYATLHKQFVAIEAEYQKIYAKTQKLKA